MRRWLPHWRTQREGRVMPTNFNRLDAAAQVTELTHLLVARARQPASGAEQTCKEQS